MKFLRFHNAQPEIMEALERISLEAKLKRGFEKWSIAGAFEVARWEWGGLNPGKVAGYKMPNEFKPWYARYIMRRCPELKGFYDLRQVTP